MDQDASPQPPLTPPKGSENGAALTEAVRHVDIVHTSLAGMTAIVLMLLFAVALPVFDRQPVTHPLAFGVMSLAAFIGIAGLYILNYRVHKHVTDQARLTEVLVNSLGQGFLFFGRDGVCGPVYSQACLEMFGGAPPAGRPITDVLRIPLDQQEDFKGWMDVLFQPGHALSFEDVARFLPPLYTHAPDRRIVLVYRPVMNAANRLERVVLIATDQTDEYTARQMAERQQAFADMICLIFKDRNQFQTTLAHVREFIDSARAQDVSFQDATSFLRQIHTLKASVKQFSLVDLSKVLNDAENTLRAPEIANDATFLPELARVVGEVSDALSRVNESVTPLIGTEYEWRGNVREIGENDLYTFARDIKKELGGQSPVVDQFVETLLAVPIRDCFHSFERELRELALVMEKNVKPIKFTGGNPPVLARPMQEFLFSLTHICRNIIDHGIEPPITRMARGKDSAGQVAISFDVQDDDDAGTGRRWLHIQIMDDGNGIDPARVRAKLYSTDPEGSWRFEDDHTVIQRILSWNFTTTDAPTALSGRGVGMEAVDQEVKKLGGTITVSSQLYKGATFAIRIPYRLDQF